MRSVFKVIFYWIGLGLAFAAMACFTAFLVINTERTGAFRPLPDAPEKPRFEEAKSPLYYTPFNGDAQFFGPFFGVMIENEITSRPLLKGLGEAEVVYEAPTEGNITRFLAIFPRDGLPKRIGPIRSARSYYLDWMHEYGGVYAHVGGHGDALNRLRNENILNADQFIYSQYYWRENVSRVALEHTMFTSGDSLIQLFKDQKWEAKLPDRLFENSGTPPDAELGTTTAKISIKFNNYNYHVTYDYDAAKNVYLRRQNGVPHIDHLTETQIAPTTVVIQNVQAVSNGDAAGTISITTIGSGSATIFSKGLAQKATWKKSALDSPTQFFDEKGRLLSLPEGQVWIEVVPQWVKISFAE
jgi:hypothetical protein